MLKFEHRVLDNGLEIIGETSDTSASVAVGYFVKTGSRDEQPHEAGGSHFLEHMLFKGTAKRSCLDINREFDEMGANYNAFTSEENTVFWANVLPEYLGRAVDLFSDMMRPSLRSDDFDMEKNVILEEIEMYEDTPHALVIDKCQRTYFDRHPLGHRVLGTKESITALTVEQMRAYFERRYRPGNIVLAATGKFDFDQITDWAEQYAGSWSAGDAQRETPDYPGRDEVRHVDRKQCTRMHLAVMSPAPSARDDRRYAADLASTMIGDSTGSRFYWALVDKALAEDAAFHFAPCDGTGMFAAYLCCDPERKDEVLEVAEKELEKVRRDGFTTEELDRARTKTATGRCIASEVPMGRMRPLAGEWVYCRSYRSLADELEKIQRVSLDDVDALIRDFPFTPRTIVSLGP